MNSQAISGVSRKHTGHTGDGQTCLLLQPGNCPECVCPRVHLSAARALDQRDRTAEVCVVPEIHQDCHVSLCRSNAVRRAEHSWITAGVGSFQMLLRSQTRKMMYVYFTKRDSEMNMWKAECVCPRTALTTWIKHTETISTYLVVYFVCTVTNVDEQEVTPRKQIRKVISASLNIGLQQSTLITSRCISC